MPRKKYTPEQIIVKLQQVDVLVSQGHAIADAVRWIGVSEQEYGGLKTEQVKRRCRLLPALDRFNQREKCVTDFGGFAGRAGAWLSRIWTKGRAVAVKPPPCRGNSPPHSADWRRHLQPPPMLGVASALTC